MAPTTSLVRMREPTRLRLDIKLLRRSRRDAPATSGKEPLESVNPAKAEPDNPPHAQREKSDNPVQGELVQDDRADRVGGRRRHGVEGRPTAEGRSGRGFAVDVKGKRARGRKARDDRRTRGQGTRVRR